MGATDFCVQLMSGPQDGKCIDFDLPAPGHQTSILIGRGSDCDISLAYDSQVSRAHAEIFCYNRDETVSDATEYYINIRFDLVDVGSRNGTHIDEVKLIDKRVSLENRQLFRVGRTWMRIVV